MSVPMISDGHGRMVEEWIGKTADSVPPDRVKLRIWRREGGKCHWTGRKILPGDKYDYEHVIAITNGGQNRESNIALIIRGKPHKEKTARDRTIKKRGDRAAKRHAGINKKSSFQTSKDGPFKQKVGGQLVWRATGKPVNPRTPHPGRD